MNYVLFTGCEDDIKKLQQDIIIAIDHQQGQGLGIGSLVPDDYFFDLLIIETTATTIELHYETKWAPNLKDLADVCYEYGVTARVEYQEDGMDIRGICFCNADGSWKDFPMEQEFLELVTYSIDDDIFTYTPTGEQGDCRDELIEKWYPKWKAEQAKVIMGQMTETEFFNDKKGGNDENN